MSAGYTSPIDAEVKKGKKGKKRRRRKKKKGKGRKGCQSKRGDERGMERGGGKREKERERREREPFNKSMNIANNSSLVPE